MSYLVYNIEDSGREHLVVETETFESAISTIENSRDFFRNGYKIYEKKLVNQIKRFFY